LKSIIAFRKEDYGWFLDLDDADASVAVDAKTGDILLNEGAGEDRFHNAAISRSAFHEFCLREFSGSMYELTLEHGLTGSHVLGVTGDKEQAETWIREATSAIRSPLKMKDLPNRRPPFTRPENCGSLFSERIHNTRVCDIKLVLEPWGERYTMQPHAAFDVAFWGPPGASPVVEIGDGAITLSAARGSLIRLFVASFGALRGASPSEVLEQEVQRIRGFGEFELTGAGVERLKKDLHHAGDAIDSLLASDSADRKAAFLSCATIARTLARCARSEYRPKRETVWRVSARILQLADLALELFDSASDELLSKALSNHEEDIWHWLEARAWDGRTPLELGAAEGSATATRTGTPPN